ncbi:hypothetical protein AB0R75_08455 [Bacillus pumilus]|uniref:hypothetical protein n=1 Tax=Bacillus TaxID=1386 RepID=UPI001B3A2D54|nr:hypothetical protein [Bacillus pumilus]MBQ4818165.1 hypothetical protein [Bacillus pumilus]WIG33678.1 hypothetical protein QPL77_08465 [Bacillus pumilus]
MKSNKDNYNQMNETKLGKKLDESVESPPSRLPTNPITPKKPGPKNEKRERFSVDVPSSRIASNTRREK